MAHIGATTAAPLWRREKRIALDSLPFSEKQTRIAIRQLELQDDLYP
jgi:hypothetical protein